MVMEPKRREVEKMRRSLMLAVALAALVFAPAAFAQDDNPSGDDPRGDDRGGERGFDDNPSRDDISERMIAMGSGALTTTPRGTT